MGPFDDYLSQFAEPEARLATVLPGDFDLAAALPLLGEDESVDGLLASLSEAARAASKRALAILVINARADHESTHFAKNASLWKRYENGTVGLKGTPPARFGVHSDSLSFVLLDRFRGPWAFGPREGVGHARKIGCDLALALHAAGKVRSPYLSTTDGDAVVDRDYFAWTERSDDACLIHPFEHDVEAPDAHALLLYEISLRYYVLGLKAARSPYAFHTIGSTLTIPARAYAAVRGFPKREAAEDFYLLSKLAKVGRVRNDGGAVRLAPRPSDRVPFGTGRSMTKIAGDLARGETYRLYHPKSFEFLARWIEIAERVTQGEKVESARERMAEATSPAVARLVEEMGGYDALVTAARTRPRPDDRKRHFHDWFDGFRTLKFLHGVRDRELALLPYETALESAPFLTAPSAPGARAWLEALRLRPQ